VDARLRGASYCGSGVPSTRTYSHSARGELLWVRRAGYPQLLASREMREGRVRTGFREG